MRTAVGRASAPAHVSGIFVIHQEPKADPMTVGSTGLGFALSPGVEVDVTLTYSPAVSTSAKADGSYKLAKCSFHSGLDGRDYMLPQMRDVVRRLATRFIPPGSCELQIVGRTHLPLSQGMGLSGAAALATGLAFLSCLEKVGWTSGEEVPKGDARLLAAAEAAHQAEVLHRSGLGDVAGQLSGGITLRTSPGLPPAEGFTRLTKAESQAKESALVVVVMGDPLSTRSILSDPAKKEAINSAGEGVLGGLVDRGGDLDLADALEASRKFATEAGLAGDDISKALAGLPEGWAGTMSMLGNSLFLAGDPASEGGLPWDDGKKVRLGLDVTGPRVLE